jgi:hypothetical protein
MSSAAGGRGKTAGEAIRIKGTAKVAGVLVGGTNACEDAAKLACSVIGFVLACR